MEVVHTSQPTASEEKKAPVKSQKWRAEEKKLFFEAVEKYGMSRHDFRCYQEQLMFLIHFSLV
jgi:hypothetical protein